MGIFDFAETNISLGESLRIALFVVINSVRDSFVKLFLFLMRHVKFVIYFFTWVEGLALTDLFILLIVSAL